jgi:hypothetical protein
MLQLSYPYGTNTIRTVHSAFYLPFITMRPLTLHLTSAGLAQHFDLQWTAVQKHFILLNTLYHAIALQTVTDEYVDIDMIQVKMYICSCKRYE